MELKNIDDAKFEEKNEKRNANVVWKWVAYLINDMWFNFKFKLGGKYKINTIFDII